LNRNREALKALIFLIPTKKWKNEFRTKNKVKNIELLELFTFEMYMTLHNRQKSYGIKEMHVLSYVPQLR
jgi:hypothetical protein